MHANFSLVFPHSGMGREEINLCSEMLLNLFHAALPYLKPNAQRVRESRKLMSKGKKVNADKLEMEVMRREGFFFALNRGECPWWCGFWDLIPPSPLHYQKIS